MADDAPHPSTPPAAEPPGRLMRRWRRIALLALGLVLLPFIGAAGLWVWAGSEGSLQTALQLAQRHLPAPYELHVEGVTGSLRKGGHVQTLQWTQPGTQLNLSGLDLQWQAAALLRHRHLHIDRLAAERLELRQHGSAPDSPPPEQLELPITAEAELSLGHLSLPDQGGLQADRLSAHYQFDGHHHRLTLQHLELAAGHYQGQISLQAAHPMALQADLSGQLATGLKAPAPQQLQARAHLSGDLAGIGSELTLALALHPAQDSRAAAMQAQVTARLQPWKQQPLPEAQARLSQIDLSLLWPGAPQTALSGRVDISPGLASEPGWSAQIEVDNPAAGPWDRQRLPLSHVSGHVQQNGPVWTADSVRAKAGNGLLELKGRWQGGAGAHWQAQARLQGLDPASLWSTLPTASISGEVQARPSPDGGLDFDTRLDSQPLKAVRSGPPADPMLSALPWRQAHLAGRWQDGLLQLDTLKLDLLDASLSGQFSLQAAQGSGSARLDFKAPGLTLHLLGDLSAEQGQGQWQAQLSDAAQLSRWLKHLPSLPALSATRAAWPDSGNAQLQGQWQGGWGAMLAAWNGRNGPHHGAPLRLSASLEVPKLTWPARAAEPPLAVQDLQARLQATLPAPPDNPTKAHVGGDPLPLQLSLSGRISQGGQALSARLDASGGWAASDANGSHWQAHLNELSLRAQNLLPGGEGSLILQRPVALQLNRQPRTDLTEIQIEAGEAALGIPGTEPVALQWEASRWARQKGLNQWQTAGGLGRLPLAWFQALAAMRPDGAALGVAGDMVFDAHWSARADSALHAQLSLKRQGGDLRLQADDLPAGVSASEQQRSAGARQAELSLQLDGDQLQAQALWNSERAGHLEARLSTRLGQTAEGWSWPQDAPLQGSLDAQLPKLGVWSVLAPPGWRMRGTLQASAKLSGTRATPQWSGQVQAHDLALRSVVEGIELRDGTLQASLAGPQIRIEQFSLRGAPGAGGDGGRLSASGQAHWSGEALQIELQAHADHLRVSARADRRLAVSGQVSTRLEQGRVTVRGQLVADQALFILPDETAPSLSPDVEVIRPLAKAGNAPGSASAPADSPAPRAANADVQVSLDLGKDFRVRGRGLDTRLRGSLVLRIEPPASEPQVSGELHTDQGHYAAYGQQLNIEQGVLRFNGPYDNPSLDILAIRPNLSTRVGVQISGTVLSPRIRLYSEPEMADADKLAWLVLGRAAANGAAESALLQQAALALLGKGGRGLSDGLAHALGLDEVSFSGVKSTDTGVSSAALKLGKRLSKDFYVSYERSLTGTLGTFYVFYDLSRRFTLRAQTGEKSAIDLIFTLRYD